MPSNSNRAGHPNYHTEPDEIAALKHRLTIHRRNLYELEEQKAKHGLDVPLRIINEIAEQEEAIAQIEVRLAELERTTSVQEPLAPSISKKMWLPRVWWVPIIVVLIGLIGVIITSKGIIPPVKLTPTAILTETLTATPSFTHTPTRTETSTATPIATRTPTLAPTPTPSYIIEFEADQTVVNPGEWVTLRWHAENVQAVYLDWKGGAGAPGTGQDTRQIWETTDHTLSVVLQNGETVTRTITITVR